ncbi:MAG: cell division protein SepF [Fimbriimonadaceae bacterium]
MEELELQERPGLFSKVAGLFNRRDVEEEEVVSPTPRRQAAGHVAYRYHVTVRRQITSFEDALTAATAFRRGEQQILNLTGTEPGLRNKIVDFMSGVNFAQDGTWEEIGENIYLIAPQIAYVEVAPASPRSAIAWN